MLPEGRVAKGYLKAEAGEGNFVLHKVLPGETVYELSRRYNIPIHLIAAWNDLYDISRIRAGQQLVFYVQQDENRVASLSGEADRGRQISPVRNKETAEGDLKSVNLKGELAAVRNNLHTQTTGQYYVVKEGDSLWEIARQFNLGTKELQQLNGLATNIIHPGDRILLAALQPVKQQPIEVKPDTAEFYYHIRSGDSLWTIARKYNVSTGEIKRWNNLNNNLIHPGNKLLLKTADAGEPLADTIYRVRSGDSLWTIARRHNISPEEIKRWNNLKDNTIYPGNRLLLKIASGG